MPKETCFALIALALCLPALAKTGPTLRSQGEIARLREQARMTDWGQREVASALNRTIGSYTSLTVAGCREKPERFFWDLMYSTTIEREYYVHDRWQEARGCPVHGTAIFSGGGQLGAWKFDHDHHPWKLQCPVGGEFYPSNDFASGDMTSGDYPDDGSGWEHDGQRYYFIQVYAHYLYLGLIRPALNNLAHAYELTGDPELGRRGAILLCKIAQEWPNSTTKRDRTYHPGYGEGSGMITDCDWSPGDFDGLVAAYDRLYTAFDDPQCLAFLRTVHPEFQVSTDVHNYVENELIRAGAQACMDRVILGNHGAAELAMTRAALVLDDYSDRHPNSKDMLHWVYYTAPGQVRYLAANLLLKDGGTTESPSYNTARLAFIPLLRLVERLRALHPEEVPASLYPSLFEDPKFRAMFDYFTDMVCIEKHLPVIGDMGGGTPNKPVQTSALNYGYLGSTALEAFALTGDPKFAQVAYYGRSLPAGPGFDVDEALVARAKEAAVAAGPHIARQSQVMDGYKLAFLREGTGDNQRTLWSFYGSPLTHGHNDPLTIGLFAKGLDLLPGIGYPQSWKDAGVWESHILTANTVCVDQGGSAGHEGDMLGFTTTPVAQWMQLQKAGVAPGVDRYRRTLVTVKVDGTDGYAVDLFEVRGGGEHHLSYHGPQAVVTTVGLDLQTQEGGTLAGPEVEFSQTYTDAAGRQRRDPFCQLTGVQRARPTSPWAVDYACGDERDVHLRLHGLPEAGDEVILADGRGATHPEAYTVKFVLTHRQGTAPLHSRFLTVLEPYEGRPFVQRAERLALPGETGAVALRVTTDAGSDLIILSDDPTRQVQLPGGGRFAGRLLVLRLRDGQVGAVAMVGASGYQDAQLRLDPTEAMATGAITAVDRVRQTVDVDWACPEPQALVGRTVRFYNDRRTSVYTVTAAAKLEAGTRLTLNTPSLVGEGAMTGADDYVIHNSAAFFYGGLDVDADGTRRPTYRLYSGATLENEDGSATFPVEGITGGGYWGSAGDVYVDRALAPGATADALRGALRDANGDGLAGFRIYDYGVGDRFEMPHVVCFELAGVPGADTQARLLNLQTTTEVQLALPDR